MGSQADGSIPKAAAKDNFVYSVSDVLDVLDDIVVGDEEARWNGFFESPPAACPFIVDKPDENLVEWLERDLVSGDSALELGCGNGRNSVYLATNGFRVDAVDISAEAIQQASKQATASGVSVDFWHRSIFDMDVSAQGYDLVYDSGCFHHLPPHRRKDYVDLVDAALKPGGMYGLVCFRPEGGSGFTDRQVYERQSLGGGLGYPEERLRSLWDRCSYSVTTLRRMRKPSDDGPVFGEDFLWTLLARKVPSA